MNDRKLSPKRAGIVVILIVLGLVLVVNKGGAKDFVKAFLVSSWPAIIIWLLVIAGGASDLFFSGNQTAGSGVLYQSFGKYADSIFTVATFGFAGSTSLALLKGLYLQLFFSASYFSGFADFDLASIFVISSFLLFYSILGTTRLISKAIFQAEASEVALAQSSDQ